MSPKIRRVLLKLSGEALAGGERHGIEPEALTHIASEIKSAHQKGIELAIVIGAGNIWRGALDRHDAINRVTADNMGMLATVINALALQDALEHQGVPTRVQSAIIMTQLAEPYIRRRAMRHLEKGRVVIFAGGTGNTHFTTDTAAALRAAEIEAQALLKATQVDGVYNSDPKRNPQATRYDRLTFDKVIADDLKVMDTAAIALARENRLPIVVFNMHEADAIEHVLDGKGKFTVITAAKAAA